MKSRLPKRRCVRFRSVELPGKNGRWICDRLLDREVRSRLFSINAFGWFLTAAALTLGAPFWFDLLNQFINLRGAGAKPAREDKK